MCCEGHSATYLSIKHKRNIHLCIIYWALSCAEALRQTWGKSYDTGETLTWHIGGRVTHPVSRRPVKLLQNIWHLAIKSIILSYTCPVHSWWFCFMFSELKKKKKKKKATSGFTVFDLLGFVSAEIFQSLASALSLMLPIKLTTSHLLCTCMHTLTHTRKCTKWESGLEKPPLTCSFSHRQLPLPRQNSLIFLCLMQWGLKSTVYSESAELYQQLSHNVLS